MATLEVTLMGPHVRFDAAAAFAVTGAEFRLTLDDAPVEMNRAIEATAGSVLKFGERLRGARAYVAVAGGVDVPQVLGSRSTHVLTGMGGHEGRALRTGDALQIGVRGKGQGVIDPSTPCPLPLSARSCARCPRMRGCSRISRRSGSACRRGPIGWVIDSTVPPSLMRRAASSFLLRFPPGRFRCRRQGQPILLMNDHATTGGYAIAGTVITADLPLAGQLAPGDWVEFEACSIETANAELRRREVALDAA